MVTLYYLSRSTCGVLKRATCSCKNNERAPSPRARALSPESRVMSGADESVKPHALGNDFLLVSRREVGSHSDLAALARAVCDRHRGIGADGLIVFGMTRDRPPCGC